MAKQHFYSRVPARASMYNRTDGFDTFAHSDGLERSFVERELAAVYENKLSKTDVDAVRQGNMPTVYSQSLLKSGVVAQSCVSYLPKDYTGERCAYLCHSLILSPEELQTLHSGENALLNPEMFISDVSGFDFQTQTADPAYPEKTYVPVSAGNPAELVEKYAPETLKAFLYALLSVLCAKGKGIFFKLPCEDGQVSQEALKFIAQISAVVPYHLRKDLSFVTYITDVAQYPHVKIKCVSENCPEPQKCKGIYVDFENSFTAGMPGADVVAKVPVNFFYSLLEDGGVREEFLLFVDKAVKTMPSLEKLNMKTLSDLVFLFGGASGLFDRQTILPEDTNVYDFFVVYEKYREALNEEYRRNVYKCLERYPQNHLAIPKNIFAKLSKLYPTDVPSAKRIAMNAVLELIHTDIMRDKLFTFLKNNYDRETPDVQDVIDLDLCSVFYGGFLQEQILEFFRGHFGKAPEKVRDAIFDKLMLSIRTVSVQEKILQFVDENYTSLSESEKQVFYTTAFEMLPECDALTASLVPLLNHCLAEETSLCRQQARTRLTEALEADCKKKEHNLLPLLCAEHGFCYETVLQLVLGPWNGRKIYGEYLDLLAQRSVIEKTEELVHAVSALSTRGEETAAKLMLALDQLYAPDMGKTDLYQWLSVDALVTEELAKHSEAFAYLFRTKITQKAIAGRVADVFNMKLRKDGIPIITQYAKENPYLVKTQQYQILEQFLRLTLAAEGQDGKNLFCILEELYQYADLRSDMADCIRGVYLNWQTQNPKRAALYEMSWNLLKNNVLLSDALYAACKECYVQDALKKQPKANSAKIGSMAAEDAGELILRYVVTACNVSVTLYQTVCQDTEGLQSFVQAFCADFGRGAEKWLLSHLHNAPSLLVSAVKTAAAGVKPQGGSLFGKLFKK